MAGFSASGIKGVEPLVLANAQRPTVCSDMHLSGSILHLLLSGDDSVLPGGIKTPSKFQVHWA
jgi:hypothetical protein